MKLCFTETFFKNNKQSVKTSSLAEIKSKVGEFTTINQK